MFGRTSEAGAPVQHASVDPDVPGGRSAAISILPGVPLPHDLIQELPTPEPEPKDAPEARELVSVGAGQVDAPQSFGVGTSTPPPAEPLEPAKRKSFSGLRRRGKSADALPEAPAGFFETTDEAVTPATAFAPAPPAPAPTFPAGFDAPHADPATAGEGHEAHVLTEVHVVSEHPAPVVAAEAPPVPTSFHPTAPAAPVDDVAMFPSTMPADDIAAFNPTTSSAPAAMAAQPAPVAGPTPTSPVTAVAPPPYLPPSPVAALAAPAPIAPEDPLFHHVPVLTGSATAPSPVAAPASAPTSVDTAPRSFLDRLRALRPSTAAPAADLPAAPTAGTDVPPPFAPPVAGAIQPPPYVPFTPPSSAAPSSAAPAPSYVPLGAPPVEAPAPPIPPFGNLMPSHAAAYPELPENEVASSGGLVFADGSHAELPAGDVAALQHVANVLAGDDATPTADDGPDGTTEPIE